jgi:ABC-type multidrug transport system permease subunit
MNRPHFALLELLKMHLREFYRVPESLFWTLLFPILLAGFIGLGFSSEEVAPKSIAIIQTKQNATHKIANRLAIIGNDAEFKITDISNYTEGLLLLRKGKVNLIVEPTAIEENGFAKDSLIFHFDKKNAEALLSYNILQNKLLQLDNHTNPYRIETIKTQGSRYIDFLIPGLLAMGIMNSALWGLGYSLVEFRVKKLMRRMVATPLPRWIFLFSHFLTRYLFAGIETLTLIIFAYFAFEVQITGSILAAILVFSTGLWAFSGISILISSQTNNLIVANGLISAITLPMTMASGVFFSYQGFPAWIVAIIEKLPLTILVNSFREVFNENAGLWEVLPACTVLTVMGTVCFGIGLKIYKWY